MQISAIALGGMDQAQTRLENTAQRLARVADPADTVDLSREMVNLMQSRDDFAANAQAARVGNEIEKTTLNILA